MLQKGTELYSLSRREFRVNFPITSNKVMGKSPFMTQDHIGPGRTALSSSIMRRAVPRSCRQFRAERGFYLLSKGDKHQCSCQHDPRLPRAARALPHP